MDKGFKAASDLLGLQFEQHRCSDSVDRFRLRTVIMVTDGNPDTQSTAWQQNLLLRSCGVRISTIAVGSSIDHGFMTQMSANGGRSFGVSSFSDLHKELSATEQGYNPTGRVINVKPVVMNAPLRIGEPLEMQVSIRATGTVVVPKGTVIEVSTQNKYFMCSKAITNDDLDPFKSNEVHLNLTIHPQSERMDLMDLTGSFHIHAFDSSNVHNHVAIERSVFNMNMEDFSMTLLDNAIKAMCCQPQGRHTCKVDRLTFALIGAPGVGKGTTANAFQSCFSRSTMHLFSTGSGNDHDTVESILKSFDQLPFSYVRLGTVDHVVCLSDEHILPSALFLSFLHPQNDRYVWIRPAK